MSTTRLSRFVVLLLAGLTLWLGLAATAAAAECRRTGSVCSQAGGTRTIGGVQVTRPCWEYTDTYECVQPNYIDYCSGIRNTWGCTQTSSVCSQYAFNGECLTYTNKFRCGDPQSPAAGVVLLDTTHTIVTDTIDRAQCAALDSNASCKKAASVCTEPGGYRTINGMQVYKDCWAWRDDYTCLANDYMNYCTPLRQSGCTEVSQTCKETGWNGQCMAYERTYSCDAKMQEPLPTNIVYLDSSYTIIRDQQNTSQCDPLANNPNCTIAKHTCVQGPATRTINGLPVYKDCWEWEDEYVCASAPTTSTCSALLNDPRCTQTGERCVHTLPDGTCGMRERVFSCKVKDETTTSETVCDLGICVDGNCSAPQTDNDRDITRVVALMEGAREAGVYFDERTYTMFNGSADKCSRKFGNLVSCCGVEVKATANNSNSALFSGVRIIGNEAVRFLGSSYMYDALFTSDFIPTSILGSIYGGSSGSSYAIFGDGSLSFYGITFNPGAATFAEMFSFNPVTFAIAVVVQIVVEYLSCEPPEQALALKKGQRLCTHVGSYCSSKFLGACIEKKESYCCYNSRLSRIINEQGRPQINKPYGDPKNPDCSGFTASQLEQLDFGAMDLTEFFDEIMPKDFDTDKFLGRVTGKIQPIQEGAAPPSGAYFPTPMTGHDPNYPIPTTP